MPGNRLALNPRVRGLVSGTTRDRGGVRPWLDTSLGTGGDRNGAPAAVVLRFHRGVADRGGRSVGQQGATSLTLRTDGQTPRYAAQRKAVNRAVNRGPPRLPCGRPSGQPLRRDAGQSTGGHLAYPADGPAAFSTGGGGGPVGRAEGNCICPQPVRQAPLLYIYMCVCVCVRHEGAPPYLCLATAWLLTRVSGASSRAPPGTGEGSGLGWTPPWALVGTETELRLREYCVFIAVWQTGGVGQSVNREPPRLPCGQTGRHPGTQHSGRRSTGQSTGGHLAYPADGQADNHCVGTQVSQQGATSPTLRTDRRPSAPVEGGGRSDGRKAIAFALSQSDRHPCYIYICVCACACGMRAPPHTCAWQPPGS